MLQLDVQGLPNDEKRDCDVVISDTAVRGADALLPFSGMLVRGNVHNVHDCYCYCYLLLIMFIMMVIISYYIQALSGSFLGMHEVGPSRQDNQLFITLPDGIPPQALRNACVWPPLGHWKGS